MGLLLKAAQTLFKLRIGALGIQPSLMMVCGRVSEKAKHNDNDGGGSICCGSSARAEKLFYLLLTGQMRALGVLVRLLLTCLRLHLLHLNGVGLAPPHVSAKRTLISPKIIYFSFLSFGCESRRSLVWLAVQLVVAHAEMQDALVDAQTGSVEDKVGRLFVDRLDHKLLVIERDVPNLAPGESDLWRQPFQCNRTNGKSQLAK